MNLRGLASVVLLVGLATTSCSSFGAGRLVSSHMAYNDAVQLTISREVLANIVRSRYADPMHFLGVSAINTQVSVSTGASLAAGGLGQTGAAGEAGASVGYSDSPTITYLPQSDAGFYKSFYGLFEMEEAVGFGLSYRFARRAPAWQALSLRLGFAAINGAADFAGGTANALYDRRIGAMVQLLQHGAALRQVALQPQHSDRGRLPQTVGK